MKNTLSLIYIFLFYAACTSKENKNISTIKINSKPDTLYYETGNIKTIASHLDSGIQENLDFFDTGSLQLQFKSTSKKINGVSHYITLLEYDSLGNLISNHNYINRTVLIEKSADSISIGDTIRIKVSLANQKYQFNRAYTGNIDPDRGIISTDSLVHFMGNNNSVTLSYVGNHIGQNIIKGHLVNFDIKPVGNSVHVGMRGSEIGDIIYFESSYYVTEKTNESNQ